MDITRSGFANAANKFADKSHRRGLWEVWPRYEIGRRKGGERFLAGTETAESDLPPRVNLEKVLEETNGVVSPGSRQEKAFRRAMERTAERKEVWRYLPLADYPDLFLRFARLADEEGLDAATTVAALDTDKNADVALGWATTYGALGLTFTEGDGLRGASPRGGPADTVSAFAAEAWTANICLRLYETATAKELDADFVSAYMPRRRKAIYTATPAATREWAFKEVARATQERVRGNAYPALYGWVGSPVQGWDFMNLLGAMWLQMFWLLTAAEAPRRCANPECDKIVVLKQPDEPTHSIRRNDRSKGYRTREDKTYCGKKCSNRHYYLTHTKPRRQAAREA